MKKTLILGAMLVLALSAQATIYNYNFNSVNTIIPDGNTVGITESTTLSGLTGNGNNLVGNVDVRLNISGGYNGDLYGYLVLQSADGSTTTSILLNRVGRNDASSFGYSGVGSGMNVTLSSSGTQNIHDVATPGSGLYLADGRTVNPSGNFSGATVTAGLEIFNNHNANGTWTLFLADMANGDQSLLVSWGLDITVVPEPATWALIIFGALLGIYMVSRQWRRAAA